MTPQFQRALLLYQQGRHAQAETELRQALASDPSDAHAHAILALCLCHLEKYDAAQQEAQQAIHLAPDFAFAHYALAWVLDERRRYGEALGTVKEAIRLEPEDADYRALEAQIHINLGQWQPALEAAETGLQFEPDHVACTNLRALALVKVGRKAEAGATLDTALARNPDNTTSHANRGWSYLEQSDPRKALEHFQEALRLDPENEWARAGLVEALKARYVIYSWMLKWFLWMAKLSPQAQWGIVIGGYFLSRVLSSVAQSNPALAPWLLPLRILYLVFALLTWTASPLFNLLLRLNRYGRFALSDDQRVASNWFGGCLLLAVISLGLGLAGVLKGAFLIAALVFGLLLIPVAAVFRCARGWPRLTMAVLTAGIAGVGLLSVTLDILGASGGAPPEYQQGAIGLLGFFGLSIFASQFIANILVTRQPTR
jgi:tetratricopeptide (TPR) repeat protein